MDGEQQSREALEAEGKLQLRLARAVVTGCFWPILKGILYGLGFIAFLIYLSREIVGR
jgi:hypothetical protein